jgi:predicted enzyme related to lactoylglutathione lyase
MSYRARPIIISMDVNDPEQAAKFYTEVLGVEFARSLSNDSLSYHAPISSDGILLQLLKGPKKDSHEVVISFAVKNLDQALSEAIADGGTKLSAPVDLKIPEKILQHYKHTYAREFAGQEAGSSLGLSCQIKTATGETIGLVQLDPHAEVFYTRHEVGATPWSSHPHLSRHLAALSLADKFEQTSA